MGYSHCAIGYKLLSQNYMCQCSTMENELFAWIMDKIASSLYVTTGMIRTEVLRILKNGNFSASNGYWLDRFMKRKRLTIRRITTSRASPSNYIDPPTRQSVALIGSRQVDAVTPDQQKISRKIKYLFI
jgi:hypothetical protein